MRTWPLNEAQYQFLEIMTACAQEPQMITDNNQILGVVIDEMLFNQFTELWKRHHQPTIAELLEELEEINIEEPIELDIIPRKNRQNTMNEVINESLVVRALALLARREDPHYKLGGPYKKKLHIAQSSSCDTQ